MDLLLCEDEFGSGFLRVVDKEDNESGDQQDGDDDGCDDCAFGHGLDQKLGFTSFNPTYVSKLGLRYE